MRRWFKKIPFLTFAAVGFLLGIVVAMLGNGGGSLLDAESLCRIKEMQVDRGLLFYHVIKVRGGMLLMLIIAGTTYLAPAVCTLTAVWIGMCLGMFQAVAILNYGVKGILLLPAATMPQFLAYLPAFYFLFRWCENLYEAIYHNKPWEKWKACAGFVLIMAAMATGIFLEYSIGPTVLKNTLNIF